MLEGTHRKLAAIVSADIAGYSRLMGADEEGTLAALKAHRNATDPVIFSHGGSIVKTTGDGLLVDFPTVVAAVRSSLEAQRIMAERDATLPADRRMQFRIGVHLGEVIVDHDDLFGETINIAARLQEIAEPGGIALSGAARDAVHQHINAAMVDLGHHELKNITEPVQVWRIDMGETEQNGLRAAAAQSKRERSAIAILPFENMSNDPEQDYFVDGITEDLITALTLIRDLKIIARNSTFTYKGQDRNVKRIASELDARYVLEGSVRKVGNRVRITAQLIDAITGQQMWAERFDRCLTDIFELQDEITGNIASRVAPTLRRSEIRRVSKRRISDLSVWDLYLRALYHYNLFTADDWQTALRLCAEIKKQDPDFAPAYSYTALLTIFGPHQGFVRISREIWLKMLRDAEKGVALAGEDFFTHAILAFAYAFSGNHEAALGEGQRALELNPYATMALFSYGAALWINGRYEEACANLEECWRRGTNDPDRYHWASLMGFAYYSLRNYDAALAWTDQCLILRPDHLQALGCRAAALAQLGRRDAAKETLAAFRAIAPHESAADHVKNFVWIRKGDIAHYCEGLIKAGMPI